MRFETIGPRKLTAVREALVRIKSTLGESVALGLAYFPIGMNPLALDEMWRSLFDAPLVGASTAGAAFTQRGSTRTGVVLGVFADLEVGVGLAERVSQGPARAMGNAVRAACGGRSRTNAVVVLTDPFACDGEIVVSALRRELPVHTRAFGGTAGDDDRFTEVKLLCNGRVLQNAALVMALSLPKDLTVDVRHGSSRVKGAREMTVTAASGHVLAQLDGRPAAEAYGEELQRLGLNAPGSVVVQDLARYSLGFPTPFGEGLLIRSPMRILPGGELLLTAAVTVGQTATLMSTTRERLVESAASQRKKVASSLRDPAGFLVFECGGRRALLGDEFDRAVAAFAGGSSVPLLGTTVYGEIAKFGGSVQGFHNITSVMAGW